MMTEFLTRLRFFIFRKKQGEFDDEVRFHLEQSIAAKVAAGLSALRRVGRHWSSSAELSTRAKRAMNSVRVGGWTRWRRMSVMR